MSQLGWVAVGEGKVKITTAELMTVASQVGHLPGNELAQIAFAGRSNVGKSTLINALLGRRNLARTSATPGKTRQLFFYRINEAFVFVDLPGYGYARVPLKERAYYRVLVDGFFDRCRPALRGCLLLLDPRRPVGEAEISFLAFLAQQGIAGVVVFTKWDRVRSAQRHAVMRERREELAGCGGKALFVGARSGEGISTLWELLATMLAEKEERKDG